MSIDWGFNGIFPNNAPSSPNFFGLDYINAYRENPYPVGVLSPESTTSDAPGNIDIACISANTTAFKWFKSRDGTNFTQIPGETSENYTAHYNYEAGVAGDYWYYCLLIGILGTNRTPTIHIGVTFKLPIIGISADEDEVEEGETITITAQGFFFESQRWQVSSDEETWADIPGETGETYTRTYEAGEAGVYFYRCIGTGLGGSTETQPIQITVTAAPEP